MANVPHTRVGAVLAPERATLLEHRTPFRDLSPEEYTPRVRAREVAVVRKKAARFGLTLVEERA